MEKLTTEWNLKDIYQSEDDVLVDFEKIKNLNKELISFKGKLNNKENILNYFRKREELQMIEEKFGCYLYLRKSANGKDEFARKMLAEEEIFSQEISPLLAFITPELSKNSTNDLKEFIKMKEFSNYTLILQDLIDNKKHVLPEKISSVLARNASFGGFAEAFRNFNNIDLKYGKISTPEGVKELTDASYARFLKHKDQKVRKKAYNQLHKSFANFNYTLGSLYLSDVKETLFFTKLMKYKSVLESCCKEDKTDIKVLPTLIKAVRSNLHHFYRYERIKKKLLGLEKYYYFDNYFELGKNNKSFSYEDTVKIVCDALKIMGENYVKVISDACENGWVDVYERPYKNNGGFCVYVYGVHPYVLLNHADTFNCVSTLAHEMGHAMHGYLSEQKLPITKSEASIFACEVASTVNEILLDKYMIENAKDKGEKLFYLEQLLIKFYATLYRQTMFSEFEYYVYSSSEQGKPLLVDDLNNKYKELQALYFGTEALKTPYSKYEWSRIPHFYRPYYVYKYSTGFISACIIANKIMAKEPGYKEKYMNFLSKGESINPIELLKSVDVDITNEKTLNDAFKLYENLLDEFEQLTKEK